MHNFHFSAFSAFSLIDSASPSLCVARPITKAAKMMQKASTLCGTNREINLRRESISGVEKRSFVSGHLKEREGDDLHFDLASRTPEGCKKQNSKK